jgi:hypothetical protein
MQDKANVYTGATHTDARAANGDTDVATLPSTTHVHTGTFTLSRTTYVHTAKLVEQLPDNILNAAPAKAVLSHGLKLAFAFSLRIVKGA